MKLADWTWPMILGWNLEAPWRCSEGVDIIRIRAAIADRATGDALRLRAARIRELAVMSAHLVILLEIAVAAKAVDSEDGLRASKSTYRLRSALAKMPP